MVAGRTIRFSKYHGNGNDFIVIDLNDNNLADQVPRVIARLRECAPLICHRHLGVGSDGILVLNQGLENLNVTVINADGSLAKNCGNGLRVVARHFFDKTHEHHLRMALHERFYESEIDGDHIRIPMGPCTFQEEFAFEHGRIARVTIGNDHVVVLFDTHTSTVAELLPMILAQVENASSYNINFVCRSLGAWRAQVFERGVGFTQSCGSGAIATAVALNAFGECRDTEVVIEHPGGPIRVGLYGERIEQGKKQFDAIQCGTAERVFCGEIEL